MASEATVSDSVDPLSRFIGPSLFARTIRASADVPVPAESKDLDTIHNFMKSLEFPEKFMNEAKRIVDGGTQLLESSFVGKVGITDAITAKGKDKPQERRQGLGLARKRASFSLKTNVSQPSVNLEPTLNLDHLQDPDEFFDAYERMENAKKEIQKQLGGSTDNFSLYKPSNNARRRRPGILGKSYNYKHRYSSTPCENDNMLMSSQETVDNDIPSVPKDESQEKFLHPDPNPDAGLEEVELAESTEKTENEVSDILEEFLSYNEDDLEGHGVLNLLQERLNMKPLDLENLYMTELPDVGRPSISTVSGSLHKPRKNSLINDSVLKGFSRKSPLERELVGEPNNLVSSPTPPRSPFASISLLKKKILQSNPLRDPFSPLNVDLSAYPDTSPAQPKDKRFGQVDATKDLRMSSELVLHVEVENTEPTTSNVDAQEGMEIAQEVIQNAHSPPPEQFGDGNASIQNIDAGSMPNEESDNNIEKIMNNKEIESIHVVFEEEARDDTSSRQQSDPEPQSTVHQAKLQKGKRVSGEKRIRNAHPMRKSLAECGTSFETGVRRSKRIKMRPLEYWKGERFLYGRLDNSLKLIGVKYFSPGKSDENPKVKPYILSESPGYKKLLEQAARH